MVWALAETWTAADVREAKADLLHAICERIVVAGRSFVGARLTPAANAHGLALALPDAVMARPTGFGRAGTTRMRPIDPGAGVQVTPWTRSARGQTFARASGPLHEESPDPRAAGLLKAGAIPELIRPIAAAFLRASGQRWLGRTVSLARRRSGAAYERLLADLATYKDAYLRAMDAARVDLVLSPPHALPALRHGASALLDVTNAASWAVLYNVLGLPAGVVPVTTVRPGEETDRPDSRDPVERAALATELESAGLPIGVQIAARRWREDLVLEGMAAIERAADARGGLPAVSFP